MKFADLFCGIGGFHIALSKAGHECVFASDIDAKCREMYKQNYNIMPHGDIYEVDAWSMPDFDILTGGFPCQPFSNGGKKKALTDKRGTLFQEIIRIARVKQPKFMILENVKHIKKIENGNVYTQIVEELHDAGYFVRCLDLSPHIFGVPQKRERVFFVCIRRDLVESIEQLTSLIIPKPPKKASNGYSICDAHPDFTPPRSKYDISDEIQHVFTAWDEMIQKMPNEPMGVPIWVEEFGKNYDITSFPQWRQKYILRNRELYEKYKDEWDAWMQRHMDLLSRRAIYKKLEWQVGPISPKDSIFNYFIQMRQSGMRVRKTTMFPTLVAIVQTPVLGKYKRYLTPRECARLQSFPDDIQLSPIDHDAYKQLGNAVNVRVIEFILEGLQLTKTHHE